MHSDLSNAVTNIDSVTKFHEYVSAAQECGMKAMAFSEHGSVFEWVHKKNAIEKAGMKYIHAAEVYLTESLTEKIRDNYHCVLIAKNYEGVKELNKLITNSFNRNDNHFYYVPRISFDELFKTSENIIVTTACIGGVLYKGEEKTKKRYIDFLSSNKNRCFLEIGHHLDEKQIWYNKYLLELSQTHNIPLIAGTDTHVLNETHERGRKILQVSKKINFDDEDKWDLKFHDYNSLINMYKKQNSIQSEHYIEAIKNTNVLADMVENFELDKSTKYPHIYDNPLESFIKMIDEAREIHPYINKRYTKEEIDGFVEEELEVYKKTGTIDYMLLQAYLRNWEKSQGIQCGYGRGSVSGSMIAYILGITKVDSKKFGLSFFRFMNPSRVTNADIDTDYSSADRDRVKEFILRDRLNLKNIRSSEIVTFNTIALKGAIRDVGRGMDIPLDVVSDICSKCVTEGNKDIAPDSLRNKYKELFEYVDIVNGTIVSIGTHPSGCLISDLPIDETIGLCTVSTSDYPVSMINMKELDELMYVKLDILGLDNIGVINETCKILGIDRLEPDNTDLDDVPVWESIRDDTTLIFQWESHSSQAYLKRFMSNHTIEIAKSINDNFSYIKWLSFGNGLIRPACASYRNDVADGKIYDHGLKELNEFLKPTMGYVTMQEDIMRFLVEFCNYTEAASDSVRYGIAKKVGTEQLLPEIEKQFIIHTSDKFNVDKERCAKIIKPFLKIISDSSDYAFSWNHSDAYSLIGYICGYLRYYHPIEFITASLNIFKDNADKTASITKYAKKVGIKIIQPKFGYSKGDYFFNKEKKTIAKGVSAVKYMSENVANELYDISKNKGKYDSFTKLLSDIDKFTSANSRQVEILIKIDYFSEFGNQRELLRMCDIFEFFKKGTAKQIKKKLVEDLELGDIVKRYSDDKTKSGAEAKSYTITDMDSILRECEELIKSKNLNDLSDIVKVKNFSDIMGHAGYISNKEEDRRKLFVKDVFPLKRKRDNAQFGYSILTQSIGSGIESRFTVFNRLYKEAPIKKDDIIFCTNYSREGSYYTLTSYYHIYE